MSMNIWAKRGHKVLVTKLSARNGYDSDSEKVKEHLEIGVIYEVDHTVVHQSSTDVYLVGFDDVRFNSVNFIDYVPEPDPKDFYEEPLDENSLNKEAYEFAKRRWFKENIDQIEATCGIRQDKSDWDILGEELEEWYKNKFGFSFWGTIWGKAGGTLQWRIISNFIRDRENKIIEEYDR